MLSFQVPAPLVRTGWAQLAEVALPWGGTSWSSLEFGVRSLAGVPDVVGSEPRFLLLCRGAVADLANVGEHIGEFWH